MRRAVIVGSTGSGKTTLARDLASRFGLTNVELDALHWDPDWTPAPREAFRARVAAALAASDRWVADGNYRAVRDIVWGQADTLVWLDYPLLLLATRLAKRTVARVARREELWNGNREDWRSQFLSKDSLFCWLLKTYGSRRREYPRLLADPEYAHLEVRRFRWPAETAAWLNDPTASTSEERIGVAPDG